MEFNASVRGPVFYRHLHISTQSHNINAIDDVVYKLLEWTGSHELDNRDFTVQTVPDGQNVVSRQEGKLVYNWSNIEETLNYHK